MKLLSRIFPLIVGLLLVGCAENPAKPAFAPADGGFSVQMPAPAHLEPRRNSSRVYGCESGGIAYLAGYTPLPQSANPPDAETLFDTARTRLVRSGKASVIKEQKSTLDGRPARDFYLKATQGYFMRMKLAVSGGRLYNITVVAPMDESTAPEIERFIDSFRFVKP